MAYIISKIDTTIVYPPFHKVNPSRTELTVVIKKDEVNSVDDKIAERLVGARPHVYRYADEEEKPIVEHQTQDTPQFNAAEFIAENANNIENALEQLTRRELYEICKFLKLSGYILQSTEHIKERIIKDVKIQYNLSGGDTEPEDEAPGG